MTGAVVVRPQAQGELDDQAEYIARDNVDAAVRFLAAVDETFRLLVETPGIGPRWESPNERLVDVRVWRVKGFENHLVFYRPFPGGIEVLHILHGARDLPAILDETGT